MREDEERAIHDGETTRLSVAESTETRGRQRGMKAGEVVDYLLLASCYSGPTFAGVAFAGRAMDLTWSDPSGLRATLRLSDAVRRRATPGHLNLLIARAGMLLRDAGRARS